MNKCRWDYLNFVASSSSIETYKEEKSKQNEKMKKHSVTITSLEGTQNWVAQTYGKWNTNLKQETSELKFRENWFSPRKKKSEFQVVNEFCE